MIFANVYERAHYVRHPSIPSHNLDHGHNRQREGAELTGIKPSKRLSRHHTVDEDDDGRDEEGVQYLCNTFGDCDHDLLKRSEPLEYSDDTKNPDTSYDLSR